MVDSKEGALACAAPLGRINVKRGDRVVRIRITRRPHGEIDGVPLDRFELGEVYDVSVSIATYLMVCGCAQAIANSGPARILPLDLPAQLRNRMKRASEKAADRPRKAQKKR